MYFLNRNVLYSIFLLLQIYKVLDFSSKLKEKNLCNPLDALSYFKATDYFFNKSSNSVKPPLANLTAQEVANYNLASIVCKIPKRQLISDADYLSREINISSITNYVSYFLIINYNLHKIFKRKFKRIVSSHAMSKHCLIFLFCICRQIRSQTFLQTANSIRQQAI